MPRRGETVDAEESCGRQSQAQATGAHANSTGNVYHHSQQSNGDRCSRRQQRTSATKTDNSGSAGVDAVSLQMAVAVDGVWWLTTQLRLQLRLRL